MQKVLMYREFKYFSVALPVQPAVDCERSGNRRHFRRGWGLKVITTGLFAVYCYVCFFKHLRFLLLAPHALY